MKNFLRQSLAKKVILFAFIIGLVSPSAMAYTDGGYPIGTSPVGVIQPVGIGQLVAVVAPSVQNLNVSTATGSATVSFSLNTSATATVWIKDSTDTIVKTLIFDNSLSAGQTYSYNWNGTDNNNQPVSSGSYKAQVVAYNTVSSDIKNYSFNYNAGSVATAPVVSVSANPGSFDPTKGQTTTVSYSLNTSASLRVEVKLNGSTIRTLRPQTDQSTGSYQLVWNGTNDSGTTMAPNTYSIEVYASNGAGSDLKTASVTITNTPTEVTPVVSVSANPGSFDPTLNQTTTVNYSLNTSASLRVNVMQGSTTVKTLRTLSQQSAGSYQLVWDGRDSNGNLMGVGSYTVQVYATNGAGSDTESASVSIVSNTTVTAPNITNVYANPTPFNPNNVNTRVYFTLDKTATVSVSILDGSSTVKNLVSSTSLGAGTYYYEWNGRDSNGNLVSDKVYTARVTASNSAGSDTESASVEVQTSTNGTCDNLITGHYVSPSAFDPDQTNTEISYTLAKGAYVSVRILDNSSTFRTLLSSQYQSAGQQYVTWNGKDSSGNFAEDQTYTYEIRATASGCSDDVETGSVRVQIGNSNQNDWPSTDENLIQNLTVQNEVFNPNNAERSTVSFELTNRAELKVQVMSGNTVIRTLRDVTSQASGDYSYSWDGRDNNGDIVNDAVYQFRVMADDSTDTDTDRAYVEVDTNGSIIGVPSSDRCAGYRDVSINSPFCKAIELMSERGIFQGYSDGTFRPNATINRAETVKVITLALGYTVNAGGTYNNGYRDTSSTAWYAPYLYVAKRNGIATGYPDNTFRPSNTINRVELLRVFLEGNQTSLYTCNSQPYDDTPINPDTRWYMKYACYAKQNDLMSSGYNNMLYPAEAMTRGDVANLFYDFETKGLYSDFVLSRTGNYYNNNNSVCVSYNSDGTCASYSTNNSNTCVQYNSDGTCYRYSTNNSNTCVQYNSDGTCANYSNSNTCLQYNTNGTCASYQYNNNTNSNYYCAEYDITDTCVRWSNSSSNQYSYNYNNNSNGYYVYQNGRYVWVSY